METDTTDANGMATATTFTANSVSGASYTVTATVAGLSTPADFKLTNTVPTKTFVFQLRGQEAIGPNFYALVGSIKIDATGHVLSGEQDYNDGFEYTSPEPGGDSITGGTLAVNSTTGQGTLTLKTHNLNLGVGGVETLGVQFVNVNHALITQFDGTATSAGSLDLQTLPTSLSGGYAFTLSGVNTGYNPITYGGVFSISGGSAVQNGLVDINDNGSVTKSSPLTGTLSPPDSFGRGAMTTTIKYNNLPIAFRYYILGAQVLRIIGVDKTDAIVGSAFGQGTNASSSTNGSLGNSIFGIAGSPYPIHYAAAGMLVPTNTSSSVADFTGVADDDEVSYGNLLPDIHISGTYSIASNGYGSLTIPPGALGDVSVLGIYLTDPTLNLSDPNNTASGLGGGLAADMDPLLSGGTGMLIPQTDNTAASFAGNYAFGAQAINISCCELDFVGQGSITGGALTGTGLVSDPFATLGGSPTNTGVMFSGTPLPDTNSVGRYTLLSGNAVPNPLNVTIGGVVTGFDVVIYQASGGQLIWINEDAGSVFLGSLQQQGSLTGLLAPTQAAAANEARSKQQR
jgi:hypothetical protein